MDVGAILLSIRLATLTAVILLVVGMPIAYWLATTGWRGRFLIEAAIALPLVLPPTVVGFYLLVATGPNSPFGQLYERLIGRQLPFTFEAILLGSVIVSFPFAVQPFTAAFAAVDRTLLEASWSLGASHWTTFRRIVIPLARPGIITGMVLTFAHTLGEFGVALMVGGNIAGSTRTASIAIYDHVQAMEYSTAHKTALVLVAFSFIALAVTYLLQGRRRALLWPTRS